MQLNEKNLREKDFHNNLQSKKRGRFENVFYKAIANAWSDFFKYLKFNASNSELLDYGCGVGPVIEKVLNFNPKKITGIDISDVSISKAKTRFQKFEPKIELLVENCEETKFQNDKFDIVYGLGILHHLHFSKCIDEISRILKSNGTLLFIEPLGTNPIINLYRRLTPNSRSRDEHPLIEEDFQLIKDKFSNVILKYYGLSTLIFFPFYRSSEKSIIFNSLIKFDQILFKIKFFRLLAWSVLIIAKKN